MEIQQLRNAIISIKKGYITKNNFVNDIDCFEHEGLYYNVEEHVVLHDGKVVELSEAMFCEYYEEYFYSQDVYNVNIYKSSKYYSYTAIQILDLIEIDGVYYDGDALDYNGYNYLEDLQQWSDGEAYYHENDECYYSYPPRCKEFARSYHNGRHKEFNFENTSLYKIGYEIEKEDSDVLESCFVDDFEYETGYIWRKETDGSLNFDGFELISPTFELNTEKIFEIINNNPILVKHINAQYSLNCGGHINLSKIGCNGNDVFNMVCGYTPLLYSLYYGRVDKNYSKGKSNKDLKNENEKYQAIRIHDNRIEFRIISAVPNVDTLRWRTRLIEKMLEYPTSDVRTAYWHIKTKFKDILKEVYSAERIKILNERIIKNTMKFEGVDLNKTRKNDNKNNN